MRSIENSAYQGQIAARMGIISVAYMQQALGLLLKNLKSDTPNIDSAVQSVRDIFNMSTKTLDQIGRTGAFHHVVRRKAAVSDTGLNAVKDIQSKIQGLPLTGEGVFGPGLEEKLKQRKDQKEQLSDLLPEYSGGSNKQQKRKYSSTGSSSYYDSGSRWNNKKPMTTLTADEVGHLVTRVHGRMTTRGENLTTKAREERVVRANKKR